MSRGVPIPDVRSQLFAAAQRVLLRDGPQAVTGRAVTREAGCATGLLYNHFEDLDDFLAALVVDRFEGHAASAAALRGRAGEGTVEGNLVEALRELLGSSAVSVARLVLVRPALRDRVSADMTLGAAGFAGIAAALRDYLRAEQQAGRVQADADVDAVALVLVATVHHLLMGHAAPLTDLSAGVDRLVRVVLPGLLPAEHAVR